MILVAIAGIIVLGLISCGVAISKLNEDQTDDLQEGGK